MFNDFLTLGAGLFAVMCLASLIVGDFTPIIVGVLVLWAVGCMVSKG